MGVGRGRWLEAWEEAGAPKVPTALWPALYLVPNHHQHPCTASPTTLQVLLVDDCGSLYEGLSSNFFAVLDGRVYTAGQGVLAGTVREVTLQVARREGIPGE